MIQRTTFSDTPLDVWFHFRGGCKNVFMSVAKNRERGWEAEIPIYFATEEDTCCVGRLYFSS